MNTLVFDDGRVLGFNTDKEIVAGIEAERVCLLGAGGAAKALLPGLPGDVHVFSRRGRLAAGRLRRRPDRERDAGARRAARRSRAAGQTVVDLAYRADGRPTALVAAARAAGCEVVDGLEALVRQGAASFSHLDRPGRPCRGDAQRPRLGAVTLTLSTAGESHGPALVAHPRRACPRGSCSSGRRSTPTLRAASRATAAARASSSSRTRSRCSPASATGGRSARLSRSSCAIATTPTGSGA